MHRSSLVISFLLCATIAACTKPDKRTDSGESTFIVKSAEGRGEPAVEKDSPLNIPTVVNFGFTVCLKDRANRHDIYNQDFFVSAPGETRGWDVKTRQEDGCIMWQDKMPYDYFAGESGWVRRKYVIQGRGVNTGSQTVEFALNPWATGNSKRDDGKAVIYLKNGDSGLIPHQLQDAADSRAYLAGEGASQKNKASLIIQDVKVKAIKEGEGNTFKTYTYIVTMEPHIKVVNSNGIASYERAPDGDYNLWMMLTAAQVGPGMDQRVGILAGQPFTVAKVIHGVMQAELHIRQDKQANWSNLELALRIVPQTISSRTNVAEFNGIIGLGAGQYAEDGSGHVYLKCFNDPNACRFDKVLASLQNASDLEREGYIRPVDAYVFSNLKLRFLMVQPGETATQRTVAYTASVCIRETDSGKPLANTKMTIRYVPPTEKEGAKNAERASLDTERPFIEQKTDDSGCLNWDGQAFHKYYQPEEYFERTVVIEKAPGYSKQFKFYINPWDTNVNFGFDAREFTDTRLKQITQRPPIPSRFFLGGYQYHTVRFLYNIDPFMDLEVKKTVLMELVPEVLRYSGIKDARKMTEHLRDGIYLLKVGIQKNYLDPRDNSGLLLENSQVPHDDHGNRVELPKMEDEAPSPDFARTYARMKGQSPFDATNEAQNEFKGKAKGLTEKEFITTTTTLVRVVSGLIIVPIELTMRDLRLMRVRSNFLIELQTVDERMIQAWQVLTDRNVQGENLVQELEKYRQVIKDTRNLKRDKDGRTLPWTDGKENELHPDLKKLYDERSAASKTLTAEGPMNFEEREKVRQAYESLESKVLRTQQLIKDSLALIKDRFERGGELGKYLNSEGENTTPYTVLQDGTDTKGGTGISLSSEAIEELRKTMQTNDFSKVKMPNAAAVDNFDIFVERSSGLEPRTFVGPVIFLSNAYSDSARATDNLDEEFGGKTCRENSLAQKGLQQGEIDKLKRSYTLQEAQEELVMNDAEKLLRSGAKMDGQNEAAIQADNRWKVGPSNNATRYDKYYGSLSHLCYKQVDDLIEEEKKLSRERENRMLRVALKANFVEYSTRVLGTPLDFLSLTDEPLDVVRADCPETADVRTCITKTRENTVSAKRIPDWLNPGLRNARSMQNWQWYNMVKTYRGEETQAGRKGWTPGDYHQLFFERSLDSRVGLCNILANRAHEHLADRGLVPRDMSFVQSRVLKECLKDGGLAHDIKLHIEKTGPYTFLGGMNLNINVGESFSTSWGHSWGTGVEFADFIGTPASWGTGMAKGVGSRLLAGAGMGFSGLMVKPVNLKVGWSLSDSEGTSISESTYLVSQVAGFNLKLERYEKCAVVSLTGQALKSLATTWNLPESGGEVAVALNASNYPDFDQVQADLRRGLFVCEGSTRARNPVAEVKEMYFYFTQHFTEGDMLDQADLYNHPWLLAMRGMRDFMTFVGQIRSQYVVDLGSFVRGVTGKAKPNQKAWALDHMANVYRSVYPTFPGFYTVLPERDDIQFLLEQQGEGQRLLRFRKDLDPLGEVNRQSDKGDKIGNGYARPNR